MSISSSLLGHVIDWATGSAMILCPFYFLYLIAMNFYKRASEYKESLKGRNFIWVYALMWITIFVCMAVAKVFFLLGTLVMTIDYYGLKILLTVMAVAALILAKPHIVKFVNKYTTFLINLAGDDAPDEPK